MPFSDKPIRYGKPVDTRSAILIDNIDDAFEDVTRWTVDDRDNISNIGNRCVRLRCTKPDSFDGKVPQTVFDALREAGVRVVGIRVNQYGNDKVRVWIEESN